MREFCYFVTDAVYINLEDFEIFVAGGGWIRGSV